MAAIDSLLGLITLRKADGLVLVADKVPTLLGGRSGEALTMPPLAGGLLDVMVEEVLGPEDVTRWRGGADVERDHRSDRHGAFRVKATREGGRAKLVVRKSTGRPSVAPPPVVAEPSRVETIAPALDPVPQSSEDGTPALLVDLLGRAYRKGASDVFLTAGRAPAMKVRGEVVVLDEPPVDGADIEALVSLGLAASRRERLATSGSVDFGLEVPNAVGRPIRFRANVFRHRGGLGAALRPLRERIPPLEELGLPRALHKVVTAPHGLVLFTGPTGSGKTTTLASLVERLNETRAIHVVTLEDPIEYVFENRRALIHQREVGTHVESFASGLRSALRESPDVILVGEMRDPETIALALNAAETGHLVLATMHAGSASGAVDRIVHAFAEGQRPHARVQLAGVLRYVVTQVLLRTVDGTRVPAIEMLAANHAVAAQIRDGRTQLLSTQMELGSDDGMIRMESALVDLIRAGRIARETALAAIWDTDAFEALLDQLRL